MTSTKQQIKLIIAIDIKGGISKNNKIPWNFQVDKIFFRDTTTKTIDQSKNNALIYGRLTLEDIGKSLPNRINFVVSSLPIEQISKKCNLNVSNTYLVDNINNAINNASNMDNIIENIFICGGSKIYNEAINTNIVDEYYVTYIKEDYNCDNFIDTNSLKNNLSNMTCTILYSDDKIDIVNYRK